MTGICSIFSFVVDLVYIALIGLISLEWNVAELCFFFFLLVCVA